MAWAGAAWILQRVQATNHLSIINSLCTSPYMMDPDMLHKAVRAIIKASQNFNNLTSLVRPRMMVMLLLCTGDADRQSPD